MSHFQPKKVKRGLDVEKVATGSWKNRRNAAMPAPAWYYAPRWSGATDVGWFKRYARSKAAVLGRISPNWTQAPSLGEVRTQA